MIQDQAEIVIALYQRWLDEWNGRNAAGMAELFAEDGNLIGFDGSQIIGRADLEEVLGGIFAHHATASYVAIIREIRFLTAGVAWLKADVGMVPAGKMDILPALNAVQTLIALKEEDKWVISVFQNTPAAFHALPELSDQMTAELRKVLNEINNN
ncbi:MAG: SgcJ/EcaC family oxidoreductase [Taibaiella sp.]|nr:SgcJ/EcaC family oxidoreductase [Taibaiella sp.]